jgi:hypothetical protein
MKRPKKGSRADIALEFINTQIGFVIGMINYEATMNKNGHITNDLKRILESMRKLKKGLETGTWANVVL